LSQELVAGWLGLTQAQLSRIENGPPIRDLGKLIHWADTLRIPAEHLWFDLPEQRRGIPQVNGVGNGLVAG
jgi:transcriptional regulator with XRE-family HTH domain